MKEAVEMIVRALVDDVEAVDVREVKREGATLIEVRVAPADMGKIIGRQGKTVRALRALAHAVSLKRKHRFVLEIVE
ncbi:MAG: KH domain-containing protein [bacterium]